MSTAVTNNSGKKVTIASRFVADAAGNTYSGTTVYEIPANRRKNIPADVFTRETLQQRTPLEVHVMVHGETPKVLTHEDFEDNKAIIFESSNDGALEVIFVRREEQRGFFSLWGMVPLCRSDSDVAVCTESRV